MDEEDSGAINAIDIDGSKMVDGRGRDLVRVCGGDAGEEEEEDSKDDVQRELRELQAVCRAKSGD